MQDLKPIATTAINMLALVRGLGRLCESTVHHLHDPTEELRELVRELERRVPACAHPSLGGVVTTIELAPDADTVITIEVFDDARNLPAPTIGWRRDHGRQAGVAMLALIEEAAQLAPVAA